jgi:hypothetical protein
VILGARSHRSHLDSKLLDVKTFDCYYLDIKRFETERKERQMFRPSDPISTKIVTDGHLELLRGRPKPLRRPPARGN